MSKKTSSIIMNDIIAIIAVSILVGLDQWTKHLAQIHLMNENPYVLIHNVFELHYLENRGAAFGILQNQKIFFVISAVLILFVIAVIFHRIPPQVRYTPLRICSVLVCAGAIGNMIDRMNLNYVVDFFYFKLIDFPIFNVADIYVVAACIFFALLILFFYKDEDFSWLKIQKKGDAA